MAKSAAVPWTREHFLIALNLYCKLPFGKLDKGNKVIIEVAGKMGRTPSSLAMKLVNFASLDPIQQARGVRGLSGATKQDRAMWAEFHGDVATLGPESEQLLHDLFTRDDDREVDFLQPDKVRVEPGTIRLPPAGPTEAVASVRVRRGQQFFRQSVLTAYGVRCCISGVNVPRLLVASHIRPWGDFPEHRLDARNGLCLSSLHDAAFDAGLITVDAERRVMLSPKLRQHFPQPMLEFSFAQFEGQRIAPAEKLGEPDRAHLAYHREVVFQR
jgi:hypothetical protein